MIKITVIRANQKIEVLSVKGHANSAPHGQDIICAGVSAICDGGANALSNPECFAFQADEGLFEVKQVKVANNHDLDVLETMLTQLKTIAEAYPKFVSIVEKGN